MVDNSFSKEERIYGRSSVNELFEKGESFFTYPFKCVYKIDEPSVDLLSKGVSVRMMVSVGKRYHKRAVRRNRVKRLTRECYRLNKMYANELLDNMLDGRVVSISYIYTAKVEEDYKTIENGIRKSFEKLEVIIKKSDDSCAVITD